MFKKILLYFLSWRVLLFLVAFLSIYFLPKFGARFPYADRVLEITHLPYWIWGFGNFDGVHYLRLAQNGYTAVYTQAFFPLYSLLIKLFNFLPKGNLDTRIFIDPSFFYTGLLLSNVFFVAAFYFLYKLWKEEYKDKIASISLLLLLSFPTAFYFGAVYSESLFLLLTVLCFWFAKKNKFIYAGIFAALASATKVQGTLLFIFLAIELFYKYKNGIGKRIKSFWIGLLGVIISPLGLIAYMYYLSRTFGNPFYFLTAQPAFGAGRSSVPFVLFPQVVYRYIKIFATTQISNPAFWNAVLEMLAFLVLVLGIIYSFKKIRFSYWIFVTLAVLLPTLTGTFSSMPRYALLAFPILPLIPNFRKAAPVVIIVQAILEAALLMFFIRGYWIA